MNLYSFDEPTTTVNNNNNDFYDYYYYFFNERKTTHYIYPKCTETEKIYNDAIERKGRIRKIKERNRMKNKDKENQRTQ